MGATPSRSAASTRRSSARYNVATIYKRAQGVGRIRAIEGLEDIMRRYGEHIVWNTLLPIGAPRRNWKQTLVSDGFHHAAPSRPADTTLRMADDVGYRSARLYAG